MKHGTKMMSNGVHCSELAQSDFSLLLSEQIVGAFFETERCEITVVMLSCHRV